MSVTQRWIINYFSLIPSFFFIVLTDRHDFGVAAVNTFAVTKHMVISGFEPATQTPSPLECRLFPHPRLFLPFIKKITPH